jgi:toxin YoeB
MGAPRRIVESSCFLKDFKKLKKSFHLVEKLRMRIAEVLCNPCSGNGRPEQLKGFGKRKIWSRRIDDRHRFVYEVRDKDIVLISCYGHYGD